MQTPSLAVLAGGLGQRMGGPKDRVRLGGEPVLRRLVRRLAWDGPRVLVVSNRATTGRGVDGEELFEVVAEDAVAGEGPVRGVLTALKASPREAAVFIPIDMPGIEREALVWLAAGLGDRAGVQGLMLKRRSGSGELIEPFPCALRCSLVPALESFLNRGGRAMHRIASLPGVEVIEAPPQWDESVWSNLNTPADVERFERHWESALACADEDGKMNDPAVIERQERVGVLKVQAGGAREADDHVAVEEPLEIRVRGRAISITMRTPGHDDELAAGFLLTEGVIRAAGDIERIEPSGRSDSGNVVNVTLAPMVRVDFQRLTRHVFAGSSCGLCGKATIEAVRAIHSPVESDLRVSAGVLLQMPDRMRETQGGFDATGGVHAAALFDGHGSLLVAREDVGRHNAVDKVVGHALLRGRLPLSSAVLVVSGRASFEIMQKAAAAGVPIIAAVSAPSSLAVSFAREMGQTLVGFVRGDRMNIYAHEERIVLMSGGLP